VQGAGCGVGGAGCRVQGARCEVWGGGVPGSWTSFSFGAPRRVRRYDIVLRLCWACLRC